jgi:hypothetical protein
MRLSYFDGGNSEIRSRIRSVISHIRIIVRSTEITSEIRTEIMAISVAWLSSLFQFFC